MKLYDTFKTDPDVENKGVWVVFGDTQFLCARAGGANPRYAAMMAEKSRPFRAQIQNDLMNNDTARDMLVQVFADTVILGWRTVDTFEGQPRTRDGVIDGPDGEELKFTRANVIRVLTDLPDLFQMLQAETGKMANFRRKALEAEAGNSSGS